MKDLLEKKGGREYSWDEATEATRNLAGLYEVMYDCWREDQHRLRKLKDQPKGFVLDGVGYTCHICGNNTREGANWYDKYGIKCPICQEAINRKEIPGSLAKNKDSWYSKYELESDFNLKGPILRDWIKKGIIKARTVTNNGKGVHYQLFLLKDNPGFFPPKKLVKSQLVKETKDGQEYFHLEPWYRFVDPLEHLKDYGIVKYLRVTSEV